MASADEPYEAALEVMDCAVNYLTGSLVASRLYLIWAALSDWFELRPTERDDASAQMRSAAAGWSAAKNESTESDAYLDHWQYDVLGYER